LALRPWVLSFKGFDFATWLLGEPISLTKLSPTEFSLEPIRADSLILMNSDELVLQIEFQTDPDLKIPPKRKRDESRSQVESLSLDQLESLGEALLDFSQLSDLKDWLRTFGA
jgi:Domain of unknown function (DUF4351)